MDVIVARVEQRALLTALVLARAGYNITLLERDSLELCR